MEQHKTNPARLAVDVAGGVTRLAKALHLKRNTVGAWVRRGAIPAKHVSAVSKATGIARERLNDAFR